MKSTANCNEERQMLESTYHYNNTQYQYIARFVLFVFFTVDIVDFAVVRVSVAFFLFCYVRCVAVALCLCSIDVFVATS